MIAQSTFAAVPELQFVGVETHPGGRTPPETATRPPTNRRSKPTDWATKARNDHGILFVRFSGVNRWVIGTDGGGALNGAGGGIHVAVCPGGGGGIEEAFGPDMGYRADVT